jgi:hypothetical protein
MPGHGFLMQSLPETPVSGLGLAVVVRRPARRRRRAGGAAGLEGVGAGERRDQDAAGLGLPPGVDDGHAPVADVVAVPLPHLGVDRLADAAEQLEARQVAARHHLLALAHQRADRRGRRVELRDLVLVDDVPEAAGVGVGRHALEHDRGRAVGQRPVDDVAVAGDPADVGGAPPDVAGVVVEDVLEGRGGVDHVAGRSCGARPWACRSSRRCRG